MSNSSLKELNVSKFVTKLLKHKQIFLTRKIYTKRRGGIFDVFYNTGFTVKTSHLYVHVSPISDTHVVFIIGFYLEFYSRWSQMWRFSEKLGHLPRPSASRYFWWLAFEYQPVSSSGSNTQVYIPYDIGYIWKLR